MIKPNMFLVSFPKIFDSIDLIIGEVSNLLSKEGYTIFHIHQENRGFISIINTNRGVYSTGYYTNGHALLEEMKNDFCHNNPSIDVVEWILLWLSSRMNRSYVVDMCDLSIA